ncbi:LLM class flavin-dependent oxidoreductase [Nocardioides zeae]|uniref:LLM class flavin-dependent oxidoreductase n=1 Tax=Nocardioides imazamoxiresistens TaxID=3231893 RepID=A0ABU3PV69_9ACTN|nr:LLM class flavin-dependent oxidoreductase [Nocardioides zeae]MDT9593132.1 LLM class flavin-dependent oxidoreductase [Nocardioides zeae]
MTTLQHPPTTAPQADGDAGRVRVSDCSVMFPATPVDPVELKTFASFVELSGMRRLYCGQSAVFEPHTTFARLVADGCRTPLGTAVTLMALRHPFTAALHARELALFSGQSYVAGLGLGSRHFNEAMTGSWPASPLTYVREYASVVRQLLDGGRVELDGRYFSVHAALPAELPAEVELALGVLRPRMTELAGEVADLGISWLTPASYCRDQLLPALAHGARGRDVVPRLATVVNVAVARPGRDPVELALAGLGNHLAAPHYGDALTKAGFDVRIGDREHNAREIVDQGLYVYGTPEEIAERLRDYRDAGVDEILINPGGVYLTQGGLEALRDLDEIARALA